MWELTASGKCPLSHLTLSSCCRDDPSAEGPVARIRRSRGSNPFVIPALVPIVNRGKRESTSFLPPNIYFPKDTKNDKTRLTRQRNWCAIILPMFTPFVFLSGAKNLTPHLTLGRYGCDAVTRSTPDYCFASVLLPSETSCRAELGGSIESHYGPLVFENESRVWRKRKMDWFVFEKRIFGRKFNSAVDPLWGSELFQLFSTQKTCKPVPCANY